MYKIIAISLFMLSSVALPISATAEIDKYSNFKTFGSVVVRCPIEKTWKTVGNAKRWFRAVIGDSLVSISVPQGNGRKLQSKFNYIVDTDMTTNEVGNTQQRLIELSDFNYQLITTFDFSTLPLGPWTTKVTLDKVTYLNGKVDHTLINFAQWGDINVAPELQEQVRIQVQGFFYTVFAPSLKNKFDDCQ